MSLACLTFESAIQEVLVQYEEHQIRLKSWIEELTERGSELLGADGTQIESEDVGFRKSRTMSGLQIAARGLFATAMQLSKEQSLAAIRLARLDFLKPTTATPSAANPCAPEPEIAPPAAAAPVDHSTVNRDEATRCDATTATTAAGVNKQNTPVRPVRAAVNTQEETARPALADLLAREAEAAFGNLSGAALNQSIRDARRRRAKALKHALQG